MTRSSLSQRIAWVIALGVFTACGDSVQDPDVTPEPEPQAPPTQIVAISADSFSGVVGTQLTEPLRVRVTDADGQGVSGVAVDFRVTSGFGTISAQAPVGDSTDANGEAEARWTLGTGAGTQTARAFVDNVGSVTFTAIAGPDVAASLEFTAGTAFIGIAGELADGPVIVFVEDQYGNPVPGEAVSFAAVGGGGSITASSTTDSNGVAEATATLRPDYGLDLFTVSAGGLPPDTFGIIAVEVVAEPADGRDPGAGRVSHDVRSFGAANISGLLVFYFRLAETIVSPTVADPQPSNAGWTILDFDLDQDTATGLFPSRVCNNVDSLPFGSDAIVILDPRNLAGTPGEPAGSVEVFRVDSLAGTDRCGAFWATVVTTVPVYRNNTLTIGISLQFLADDGIMDFTSAWVSAGDANVNILTDLVPDSVPHTFDLTIPRTPPSLRVVARGGLRYVRFPDDVPLGEVTPLVMRAAPIEFSRMQRRVFEK